MRPPIRILAAAAAASAVLTLAACGGSAGSGAGGAAPEGAALLAADTPVLVSLGTDFESEQWQAVEALVDRFPSGPELWSSLSTEGADFEADVKPALGPETDVALFDLQGEEPTVVLLTQPPEPAKLEALLAESEEPPVWRVVDGWYVVADSEEAIDRALAAGDEGALADSETFREAMESLPGEAVARIYLDGAAFLAALQAGAQGEALDGAGAASPLGSLEALTGGFESLAVALVAEAQGVRLEGVVSAPEAPAPKTATPELLGLVPADPLLYVSFNGLDEGLSKLLATAGEQSPDVDQGLGQLELVLGISVEDDLLRLFAGEGALYVRAGVPVPEATLVLSPEDPARALATVDQLVAAVATFGALGGEGGAAPQVETADTTIAGLPAKQIELSEELSLYYALVEGRLVVTTGVKGIADLVEGSGVLADDPQFQEARRAASMPEETAGFLYLDFEGALGLLEAVEGFRPEAGAGLGDLAALRYLLLHVGGGEGETRFAGFLGIE